MIVGRFRYDTMKRIGLVGKTMRRTTKDNICEAAIALFNTKGYAGTSVREIAKHAQVNVSLISYYFKGKHGLLERLMGSFFETYLEILEKAMTLNRGASARKCIHETIIELLSFQQENSQLARFVHRETTIDSTLTREIMTVYLRKEKFYWQRLFDLGLRTGEFRKRMGDMAVIQLKALLTMPFSNPQYVEEIFQLSPSEDYFVRTYGTHLIRWFDEQFCPGEKEEKNIEVG